jgi:apolipoprotein N-acyltransferase
MFKIEYSILGYPAHNTFFVSLAGISGIGNIFLVVFFLALINTAIGSILFEFFKAYQMGIFKNLNTKHVSGYGVFLKSILTPLIIITLSFLVGYSANIYQSSHLLKQTEEFKSLKIATIQDQSREGETFGKEIDGVFQFKKLEELLEMAKSKNPDIIIYPFAPWDGVIYNGVDSGKNNSTESVGIENIDPITFNKDVFAVSFKNFGEWQKKHVASSTVFVTWATTYRDKKFFNEITYWKNGQLLGTHQKKHLFPFLDYTPAFTQSHGLYTTAVDITPGTTTLQEKIGGVQVGALVCSEVTHPISDSTSHDSDIVLSIGSEAFFSSGIAGDLNVANATYRAAESSKPIIRSNRFGPSAFIDQTGKTIAYMPFGVTGVLVDTIQVPILKK